MDPEITITKDQDDVFNKKIETTPKPRENIGIETDGNFTEDIMLAAASSTLDVGEIEHFTTASHNRDTLYAQIDSMCLDSTIAAVLEDYATYATEYNTNGKVMWAESDNPIISDYINFLLDSLNVDKNLFKWAYCLCKYGDVYLRLVHESEYDKDIFKSRKNKEKQGERLTEAKLVKYSGTDKYALYFEMQHNPAEIFELTQHGKTSGYIRTHINASTYQNENTAGLYDPTLNNYLMQYKFDVNRDVELYDATEFIHGCLEVGSTRYQEKVNLFFLDQNEHETDSYEYSVRSGQSALYDSYKTWRELQLLEASVLLNRLTQSSTTRIISIDLPDMPKEQAAKKMAQIKSLIEQKSAINTNNSFYEYTNPGPIVNNVYVPTHDGKGTISTQTIGGDPDPKSLADLEYYRDRMFGSLRTLKQLYGHTGDSAGFDGGQSIAQLSSRFAKFIKNIQNILIQMVTDGINILLLDRELDSYINQFSIKMTPPATAEANSRLETINNRIDSASKLVEAMGIEDKALKLKVMKSLLADFVDNQDVLSTLQEEIDKIEKGNPEGDGDEDNNNAFEGFQPYHGEMTLVEKEELTDEENETLTEEIPTEERDTLPNADELGIDLLNM